MVSMMTCKTVALKPGEKLNAINKHPRVFIDNSYSSMQF